MILTSFLAQFDRNSASPPFYKNLSSSLSLLIPLSSFQMDEISQKRQTEESHHHSISSDLTSSSKRQKPYNTINLLHKEDDPESEPELELDLSQDLSAIFTTSSSSTAEAEPVTHSQKVDCGGGGDELDESVKSVLTHLLEASDDELGIPNVGDENGFQNLNSNENLAFAFPDDDGLWELEDVAASYCSGLQSQLFM